MGPGNSQGRNEGIAEREETGMWKGERGEKGGERKGEGGRGGEGEKKILIESMVMLAGFPLSPFYPSLQDGTAHMQGTSSSQVLY